MGTSSAYSKEGPSASVVGAERPVVSDEAGEIPETHVSSVLLLHLCCWFVHLQWSYESLAAFISWDLCKKSMQQAGQALASLTLQARKLRLKMFSDWAPNHTFCSQQNQTQSQCCVHCTIPSSTPFVNFNNSNPNSEVSLYHPALLKRDLTSMMWINGVFQSAAYGHHGFSFRHNLQLTYFSLLPECERPAWRNCPWCASWTGREVRGGVHGEGHQQCPLDTSKVTQFVNCGTRM